MYRVIVCAAWLGLFSEAAAQDLGVQGQTFPVTEPDLFEEIAAKFAALEASGEVAAVNGRLQERAVAAAARPRPVSGIVPTTEPHRFHVDPTITLTQDIKTPDGALIARAGESFNPLDHTPMRQRMIFFDGDLPDQVVWAQREVEGGGGFVSPVLTNGPVLELSKEWRRQVFFDQGGKLTQRFGITQVPARVSRDGYLLLVEEVLP